MPYPRKLSTFFAFFLEMIYYDKGVRGDIYYYEEKTGKGMSEARDRKMKRERRFQEQKAEKVLRACRSRRGYELFQEQDKKKVK